MSSFRSCSRIYYNTKHTHIYCCSEDDRRSANHISQILIKWLFPYQTKITQEKFTKHNTYIHTQAHKFAIYVFISIDWKKKTRLMYSLETVLKQRKKEQILKDSRSHATKHATSIAFTHTTTTKHTARGRRTSKDTLDSGKGKEVLFGELKSATVDNRKIKIEN